MSPANSLARALALGPLPHTARRESELIRPRRFPRAEIELGSRRASRPAGRAAGLVLQLPRIVCRAEVANGARSCAGKLIQVLFAQDYSTGGFEPAHHFRIGVRHPVLE